ncbi:MAG: hypothetical protein M3Q59_03235 [Actinomycetota bacterium]|nr:hypothetical protein [Actinomycetota bacterium]
MERPTAAHSATKWDAPVAADLPTLAQAARGSLVVSNDSVHQNRADNVAGLFCAFSFALSGLAIARQPGLLAPVAILLALVAARMTVAHRTLAGVAVVVAALAFFVGMIVSITTDNALF